MMGTGRLIELRLQYSAVPLSAAQHAACMPTPLEEAGHITAVNIIDLAHAERGGISRDEGGDVGRADLGAWPNDTDIQQQGSRPCIEATGTVLWGLPCDGGPAGRR